MVEQEDSDLVRQCLAGNRAGFDVLVKKYLKPIYNLAFRMVNDGESAADIAQTTFIKAYENLQTFNLNLRFFSWLYRIAINESLNALGKRRQTDELSDEIASNDATPDEVYHQTERKEIVQRALQKLKPDYRSVIILRHFMDLTYEQMSATLGIPEKKVKSRLFSARHQLRGLLANKGL
ncbi:MAG TPA: sigma-70 family RNA polymerase sigma factor [Bacteroidota bacterium]|nr:sigma-70 family RNA polymerase sigma factor [Bacteroidota bacterium]